MTETLEENYKRKLKEFSLTIFELEEGKLYYCLGSPKRQRYKREGNKLLFEQFQSDIGEYKFVSEYNVQRFKKVDQ